LRIGSRYLKGMRARKLLHAFRRKSFEIIGYPYLFV
jgi:hypothetical protein